MNLNKTPNTPKRLNPKMFALGAATIFMLLWQPLDSLAKNKKQEIANALNIELKENNLNIDEMNKAIFEENKSFEMNGQIIDKDSICKAYIANNIYIWWKSITETEFGYWVNRSSSLENWYNIIYTQKFKWIKWFEEQETEVSMKIDLEFIYENNNIYIKITWLTDIDHSIELPDNWEYILKDVVYDYEINGLNKKWKAIDISFKANPEKTENRIKEKIKWFEFKNSTKIKNIKEYENTQITKLNDISLWKEVYKEWDKYYRDLCIVENKIYRPILKVYFDQKGKLDETKTKEQIKDNKITVFWVDIKIEKLELKDNTILVDLNQDDIAKLIKKVKEHRTTLIELINNAEVWPNSSFTWFNKEEREREWSNQKERTFDSKLMSLQLVDDTYIFTVNNWDKIELYFGMKPNKQWKDEVYLKNKNNQEVGAFFINTDKEWFYKATIESWQLKIIKIKKEWENVDNQLPEFSWQNNMESILENESINTFYNEKQKTLEYFSNDWTLITSIKCEKKENGTYKLEKQENDISIQDLYNYKDFANIVSTIETNQLELNILDVDILNSFKTLLSSWQFKIKNKEQNLIKINDGEWNIYYCEIKDKKNTRSVSPDQNTYEQSKKALNFIKSRLEVVKKLQDAWIKWKNNWKEEDFTKFVWWWRGIGKSIIKANDIINFISWITNTTTITILRWEWQRTEIVHDLSRKWRKIQIRWKDKVDIWNQWYSIKINNDGNIILDPIEIK